VFQALRLFVNKELESLEQGIGQAAEKLSPEGILAVVSFHSLEDRIVKNYFAKLCGKENLASRYVPAVENKTLAKFRKGKYNFCAPTEEEIKVNSRASSAKLRYIIKNGGEIG
jgi:16S rRNA (cytosine1402-N4)-methyltransferase